MKKILTNVFIGCLMLLFIIGAVNVTVYADTYYETEESYEKGKNDTMETAEIIEANQSTPKKKLDGDTSADRIVRGTTKDSDPDWFKVFLTAGEKYFTCNENAFNFAVMDKEGTVLVEDNYLKTGDGPTAYSFSALNTDYYYVKIIGRSSSSDKYLFMIGNPCYALSTCGIPCEQGTISMDTKGEKKTVRFNGEDVSGIPEDALAYSITMSRVGTVGAKSISVKNENTKNTFNLEQYTWGYNNLLSFNLPVASTWSATFEYFKTTSFTPVLTVRYVYPIYYKMKQ